MATITITEALKYVSAIKISLSKENHLENYKDAILNRSFVVTTAMTEDRYNVLLNDTSITEEAVKAYEVMNTALTIMENLKTNINKKNTEIGIDEKILKQSLLNNLIHYYNILISKFKDNLNTSKFTYDEAIAQLTEEKKTLTCFKPFVSSDIVDNYKKLVKEAEKEVVRLGNEIAALNHTTTIDIDEDDLKFIEEFC